MKKRYAFPLLSTVGVLLILAALVLLAPTLVNTDLLKQSLEQYIQNVSGRRARFNGDMRLTLVPGLGFECNNATLANTEGFGSAPLLSVGHARVEVRLLPLFARRVEFKSIRLDDVMVNLRRAANGTMGLGGYSGDDDASAAVGGWTFAFTPSGVRADNFGLRYADVGRGWSLDIRNGTLSIEEDRNRDFLSLAGNYSLDVTNCPAVRSAQGVLQLKGEGKVDHLLRHARLDQARLHSTCRLETVAGERVDAEVSLDAAWNSRTGDVQLRSASLRAPGVQADVSAAGRLLDSDSEMDGNVSVALEKPAELLQRFGLHPPPALASAATLRSRFSGNASALNFSDIQGDVGGAEVRASVHVQWFDTLWAAVDLHLDRLDMNAWTTGVRRLQGKGSGARSDLSVKAFSEAKKGQSLRDALRRLNLDLLFRVDEVRAGRVRAGNATLDVAAHGGLFEVRKLAVNFAKGRLSSSLRVRVFEDDLAVKGGLNIRGTRLTDDGSGKTGGKEIFSTRLAVGGRVDGYRGRCEIARFRPSDIIYTFGLDLPELPDGKTWRPVSARFDFEGTEDSFLTRSAMLAMNGDVFNLDLDVVNFARPDITFSARTREVDVDKLTAFLGALSADTSGKSAGEASNEPGNDPGATRLPTLDMYSRIKGRVRLDSALVAGKTVRKIDFSVDSDPKAGDSLRFKAQVHGGGLALDALRKPSDKTVRFHVRADNWESGRLHAYLERILHWKFPVSLPRGRLDLNLAAEGRGETLGELLAGCSGRAGVRFDALPVSSAAVGGTSGGDTVADTDRVSEALSRLGGTQSDIRFTARQDSTWQRPQYDVAVEARAETLVPGNVRNNASGNAPPPADQRNRLNLQANATVVVAPVFHVLSTASDGEGTVGRRRVRRKLADSLVRNGALRLEYVAPAASGLPPAVLNGTFALNGRERTLQLDRAVLKALDLHLNASGKLFFGREPMQASGRFELKDFNPRELIRLLGGGTFRLRDDTALRRASLSSQFNWQNDPEKGPQHGILKLEDLQLGLDQTLMQGKVALHGLRWPKVTATLRGNTFHYNRYLPARTGMLIPLVYPLEEFRKLDLEANVNVGELTIYSMTFTDCKSRVTAKNGRLAVTDTTGSFKGGKVRGSVFFQAMKDEMHFSTEAVVRNFEMGGMLEEMAGKDYIRGKADFSLNLNGHGATDLALLRSLAGRAGLVMGKGAYNFDSDRPEEKEEPEKLELDYTNFLHKGNFKTEEFEPAWTHFSKGSISIKVQDGVATSDDLYLNEPLLFSATGEGFCDLYLEYLDYTLTVSYLNAASFPVRLRGPWDDVKAGVSTLGILGATGKSIVRDVLNLPINVFRTLLP
jgi:uncharacterized protein involved in outer membrane biogenesis